MRNRIFGGIGILWGGAILLQRFIADSPQGSGAYQSGQSAAVVFGAAMLVAGLYYFFRKPT
jgi:hypothetical protein